MDVPGDDHYDLSVAMTPTRSTQHTLEGQMNTGWTRRAVRRALVLVSAETTERPRPAVVRYERVAIVHQNLGGVDDRDAGHDIRHSGSDEVTGLEVGYGDAERRRSLSKVSRGDEAYITAAKDPH
jgi:hypothetical protein